MSPMFSSDKSKHLLRKINKWYSNRKNSAPPKNNL